MNQHTIIEYSDDEINKIISLYESGISFTKIGQIMKRQKNKIKTILINNNVWVDGKNTLKKQFTDFEIENIKELYTNSGLSCKTIGDMFNVSRRVIQEKLRTLGLLRKIKSNGIKIILTTEQELLIKNLYLDEYKGVEEISNILKLSKSFINKHLSTTNYRRNKSDGHVISTSKRVGKKFSEKTINNMKLAQQKLAKSGKRIQTGGVCKTFMVNELICKGTYEKFYIEKLIKEGVNLPENSESITTPFGVYYPDFKYDDKYIEIKSDYTYDILIGLKENRFTKKIDITQYNKIKWVNKNIIPVDILMIDKRNNMIIKQEIK